MSASLRLSPRDLGLLALLTLSWGVNWPVMKIGVTGYPPMTFRTLCMLGALPLIAAMSRVAGVSLRVERRHRRELVVLVLTNLVLWLLLTTYGIMLLSSGRAAILAYTMPVWAAAIGILLYGEHPSRRLWVGVAAAAIGVLMLVSSELTAMAGRPLGTLLMLSAAVVWGYGTHRMRRRTAPTPVLTITFWSFAAALVVCGAVALAFERDEWTAPPSPAVWGAVLFNATAIFGFAQLVWFRLATILPPVASGLSIMAIPVLGLFSGMVLLGEQPEPADWFALAAVLVAMGSVLLPARSREKGPAR